MLKQLVVSELTPGMMVTRVIEQSGPVRIRKVGFIRSPDMIKGLKEMGVKLVEVNLDESLNVELETEVLESADVLINEKEAVSTKTATQRLVASNKQIADVDRQLSQQFHRSLFLPAVDQMPSKWTLYGKPYALLFAYVVVGLLIGSVSTYTIRSLSTSSQVIVNQPQKEDAFLGSSPSAEIVAEQVKSDQVLNDEVANLSEAEKMAEKSLGTEDKGEAVIAAQSIEDVKNVNVSPLQEPSTENKDNSPADAENVNQQLLVNGVLLEEGQQLLGYQGADDAMPESNDNGTKQNSSAQGNNTNLADSSQSVEEDAIVNSELFRRIQRVAEDVDSQPTEPVSELVRVTDLNDLPRIDQLSPALLTQMPAMSFSAHMYASNPQDRWVRVNSTRVGEGDIIANKVLLKRIESEKVVLEYKGTEFTMNALSDW